MNHEHSIGYAEAKRILGVMQEEIEKLGKAGVLAVCDAHGDLIAFARMDGGAYSSINVAMNKAYSAARERKPTKEIGTAARDLENGFNIAYYGDPRFTGWGGGVPVLRDGNVVGAVAVAGLLESEDVEIAERAAAALMMWQGES